MRAWPAEQTLRIGLRDLESRAPRGRLEADVCQRASEAKMRQLLHIDNHGADVAEVLTTFNDRRESLGVSEVDVVSVSVLPPDPEYVANLPFADPSPNVRLVIVHWA
jgi:hypothetical protein